MADNKAPRGGGPNRHGFQRPQDMGGTVKRLLQYVVKSKGALVLVAVCLAVSSLASVATSYLLKPILNDYVIPGDFKGLLRMLLLQGGLFGLSAICSYTYARIMVHISQRAVAAIRKDLFAKLQTMPLPYFDTHQSGDLMSRFTNDIDTVSE
ncbi:MAG: ABC transporter ATP-binding protein, partial [Oscillospiraceae bacterium]|nr:ABC transporter ATP-binding protein [Oscillospiraceae bacterium]